MMSTGSLLSYSAKGAYVSGSINITSQMGSFYLYVGGKGGNPYMSGTLAKDAAGGWNGGGIGRADNTDDEASGAGGGATDIRIVDGDWDNTTSLRSRIIVAAGAGGYGRTASTPGFAGGLWSGSATYDNGSSAGATVAKQNTGYKFGIGQDGTRNISNNCTAGGGGGWYGGGTSVENSTYHEHSANGGSSFISGHPGCNAVNPSTGSHLGVSTTMTINSVEYKFSPTVMIDGDGNEWTTAAQTSSSTKRAMPNPNYAATNYASGVGHTGSGFARITLKPYE